MAKHKPWQPYSGPTLNINDYPIAPNPDNPSDSSSQAAQNWLYIMASEGPNYYPGMQNPPSVKHPWFYSRLRFDIFGIDPNSPAGNTVNNATNWVGTLAGYGSSPSAFSPVPALPPVIEAYKTWFDTQKAG